MKKAILILCIVALVVSATAAMASSTYWQVKFKAGMFDGTTMSASGGSVALGVSPTALSTPLGAPANDAAWLGAWDGSAANSTLRLANATNVAPYTYTLRLAVNGAFAGSANNVYITCWAADKMSTTTGRDMPAAYSVTIQGNGVDQTWSDAQLKVTSDPAQAGPVGFWFSSGTARSSAWDSNYYDFTVTVGPVPEPGSFLALGSGLIGMAGFAIRRRRA